MTNSILKSPRKSKTENPSTMADLGKGFATQSPKNILYFVKIFRPHEKCFSFFENVRLVVFAVQATKLVRLHFCFAELIIPVLLCC